VYTADQKKKERNTTNSEQKKGKESKKRAHAIPRYVLFSSQKILRGRTKKLSRLSGVKEKAA
jgi:hypothetical protein